MFEHSERKLILIPGETPTESPDFFLSACWMVYPDIHV